MDFIAVKCLSGTSSSQGGAGGEQTPSSSAQKFLCYMASEQRLMRICLSTSTYPGGAWI
jgi:hypothetical protein